MRSTSTGMDDPARARSASPEVSTSSRARPSLSLTVSICSNPGAMPGGFDPDTTTQPPASAASAMAAMVPASCVMCHSGPGMTNRYCPPVARSVTASDWRVSPGAVRRSTLSPAAFSMSAMRWPVAPPRATIAVDWPPMILIARLTLMPPPTASCPTSSCAATSRSSIRAAAVDRSSAGFSVTVRMGA